MAKNMKKGFTLIELIVVLAIIGILAAILVPSLLGYVKKSRRTADITSAKNIRDSVLAVLSDEWDTQDSFAKNNPHTQSVTVKNNGATETYTLVIVCSKDGAANAGGNHSVWGGASADAQLFLDQLNDLMGHEKAPIKLRKSSAGKPLNRWFVCYRDPDPLDVEIWVGDGTTNTPMYRVCPDTDPDYR